MASEPIIPWDYYQRMRSGQGSAKPDPVAETVASIRAQQAKRTIMDAPDTADDAARVSRIARATGEAPLAIEGRVADYEKAQNADYMGKVLAAIPFVGQYFADNPRALVAAQDDHKAVGLVGGALEFFKGIPGAVAAGYYDTGNNLSELYQSIDEVILPFTNPSGGRAKLDQYDRNAETYRAQAKAVMPESDNVIVNGLLQGPRSFVPSLTAMAVGIATRSPTAAASMMGVQTGAPAYREALRAGKDTPTALRYGFEQGAIEALTERMPAGAWLDALTKRTPVGQAVLRNLATELPGEQVATVLQDFSTWATLTPDRPFSEYLAERPSAALQTALATVSGTGLQVGATQLTARTGDALVAKVQDVRRARAHADVLTRFEKAAADSTLRKRDGEAYAAMVGDLAAKNGIESVLVPAEAVREYMQSDGYDRFSDPFESYRDQVDEAYAVGGDVVLPADFALGTLPGTAAWSALRDDIRLTSGGMSPREAQTFDDAMAEVVAEFESEMQAEYTGLQEQLDAQGKLLQSVRDKLMNAGFTPYAAAQQAELIARRITTRAARNGQEVTGNEFTTEVRQVLPPELAAARAADATDLVINALRRGKDATIQSGPSLLEWISKRGGVNDPGGDLASMGLDQWHKGKPGKRKLVRKFDAAAAMGGVSGAGDYGVDTTLRAAIDAGFFPELMELENEAGPSQFDTQVLLDAMSAELAGSKRYASDPRVDGYRAAAAELDQMLAERGLDPTGMSDAELRAVIAQMDTQGEGGFEQLPDTIDIDGVQRPTRNSEGQPIAGSEEGVRAFWNWFGESKVVDAEGRPLVVYHGTGTNIDAFNGITWASVGTDLANEYASMREALGQGVATILPLYVRAERIFDADAGLSKSETVGSFFNNALEQSIKQGREIDLERARALLDTIRAAGKREESGPRYDRHDFWNKSAEMFGLDGAEAIREMFGLMGFDGIKMRENGSDTFGAFSPTQIKSINNRGTFDPADPRILFQSPREYYQSAYHGSPHLFDKFSLDAIGTGEGAQAYGWGLYFAGRREIAEHYRKALAGVGYQKDGAARPITEKWLNEAGIRKPALARVMTLLDAHDGDVNELLDGLIRSRSHETYAGSKWMAFDEAINLFSGLAGQQLKKAPAGRLYEVEIPDDGEYLLWDKPLSEQPEKVKAAIEVMGLPLDQAAEDMFDGKADDLTGKDVYEWFSGEQDGGAGSDRAASLALHDAGIAGIKYLDGGSRSDGEGSFNYVVFDDNRVSIRAYEQAYKDGPRGRIRFEQVPVIELFQGRNLSTLLHELGHQYLEELRFDAESPDAPTQLVNDMETVKAWFAANGHPIVDGFIPVEAHELWARGFERYLMEGKAPSSALARVFETLRGWMLSIYKKVEALRSPITPEIREVFDRLLATDEEIQAAREQQALMPLFKDAAAVGMTGPEFEAYQAQFDEARVAANGEVLAKTMATIRRRVTAEYREQRAKVEEEVTARVDGQPLFKALRNLKAEPINADWLRDNMGEDVFSLLPKRVPPIWKDRGAHPDSVAEMSGYATGRQMVEALIGAELAHRQAKEGGDQRPLRVRAIQTETDAEMNAMVGDPLGDGTIEREALAAVNSEKQGEVMASELRAISRRTGQRPTPYKIARQWARTKVRQGAYNVEASPAAIQRHTRAVAKAGGEAERALMAGKFEDAFAAKQRQMLSSALLAEAKAAGDEVDAARKRLDKIARRVTSKSVDQDYLDQAHALLEAVDLRQRSQKSLDRKERFADWAAARAAEGFDVVVPVSFGETLGQTNWSRLPVETLLALDDAVAQVMHLGRLKQTLLDNQERREFDAVVSEAVETAGRNGDNIPPSDLMEPSFWDRAKSRVAAMDAALLKMETVFDWLDGGDLNGIFNRVVFRPIAEAQHNEQAKIAEIVGKLNEAANKIPAAQLKRWGDRFSSPVLLNRETGNPFVFTREQLISVALNFGNRGNLDKLLGGYGWNEGAVKAVLDENLTAEEWAYVQEVWDTIDGLWPEIEAMEKRLNGVAPERVEAVPVETPYGTMRGGYFPVVYDPARNYDAAANAAKNSDLFENIYTRATTTRGFTKARTEVQRPIHLSLGIINRHVAEVVHDLTHREAIMQADKFLSDKRVRRAVDEALGPEISKAFRPWLQRIANEWAYDRAGLGGFENFLRAARLNATIVGMGFRFSTVLMQGAGFSNSFEVVGERWVGPAIARAAANPIEAYNFVIERSGEVRARMDTLDRDIRDNMKRQAGGVRLDAVKRFAFHGIGYMDRVVVVPTWIGAYDKAIAAGMTEDQAIYAADKAVRQSQGAGAAKDLAAVQAGRGVAGEALKLLTMFYAFMSASYQRQRTLGRDIRRGSVRDLPRHLARAWWLVIVPPVLSELLAMRGPDEDDDEEWGAWAFKKIALAQFGAIPVARDVMPILYAKWADEKTFGYRATPATGAIESLSRLSDELERAAEGEETKQLTRTSIETVGYFTGLTTGQIAATSQFLVDVGAGDADPQGLSDWMEGITTGRIKED